MKDSNREAFENWAKNNGYHVSKNPVSGIYLSLVCNDAWKAWQAAKASAVPDGYVLVRDKPVAYMVQNKFWKGEFEVKLLNEMPEPEFEGDSYDVEIPLYMIEAAQEQE